MQGLVERRWLSVDMIAHHLAARAFEQRRIGQQMIDAGAERVDIAAHIEVALTACLFRRDVVGRAKGGAFLHQLDIVHRLDEAEITQFHDAFFGQHDVGWLDIAVNDVLGTQVAHRLAGLQGDVEHLLNVKRAFVLQQVFGGDAIDEFHREIVFTLVFADIVDLNQVLVRQFAGRARLKQEALAEFFVTNPLIVQDLEGDLGGAC